MAESGKELWPACQLSSHGYGGDEGPSCGSDEGGGVSDGLQCLLFYEALDLSRETGIVDFGIVLENEPSNGPCGLIFCLDLHKKPHNLTSCVFCKLP